MSVEIHRGIISFLSSFITPFLYFLYPISTFISFLPHSFPTHFEKNNNENYRTCYTILYLIVFATHIKRTSKSCLMVASLVK
jgi:hypothetical protein